MKTWVGLLGVIAISGSVFAQDDADLDPLKDVNFQEGPVTGELSSIASLEVPEGYFFVDADGTGKIMEFYGNIPSGTEIGYLESVSNDWWAVFQFDACGYVKDDEKNDLDSETIMESLRTGQVEANKRLASIGSSELEIDGWYKEPFYNDETKNLEWCTKIREKGSDEPFANHNIRILGRYGLTKVILVAGIDDLETAIPELAAVLENYEYNGGNAYAEYRKGDKVAKYGLTALVAGGAAAVALKSGLFKYIWKLLVIGGVAVAGFFKKLSGKKKG